MLEKTLYKTSQILGLEKFNWISDTYCAYGSILSSTHTLCIYNTYTTQFEVLNPITKVSITHGFNVLVLTLICDSY